MDLIFSLMEPYMEKFLVELNPARLLESFILLVVIWRKVRPHLTTMENEMKGVKLELNQIREGMDKGFELGNKRFEEIENRLDVVETNQKES